ncbi:nitroreductase family protein [Brevibacillus dissolubilis]|uniref:nitroreductase family protein n=1 Tax=Brevibacillus dissolubilis TaxID=1844116 RepID=UPI0011179CC4|nr:nitroreductase family protein [Brevibacillus dissolubilis]
MNSEVKPNSVEDIVKIRRSANNFDPDVKISKSELEGLFELAKFAPSAYNLQHAHYLVVDDPQLKLQVKEAAHHQYKVGTASAAILVLGDMDAYKDAERIYEGMLHLGMMDEVHYRETIDHIYAAYQDPEFRKEEAIRNASLSAMQFMLIAKAKGWDTCPMIGFDPEQMRSLLRIPDRFQIAMMITIGVEKTNRPRPRGYRKPVGEFVHFGPFSS